MSFVWWCIKAFLVLMLIGLGFVVLKSLALAVVHRKKLGFWNAFRIAFKQQMEPEKEKDKGKMREAADQLKSHLRKSVASEDAKRSSSTSNRPVPRDGEEAILWEGRKNIEFSYAERGQKKYRVRMCLEKVVVQNINKVYLCGFERDTGEVLSLSPHRIRTMIVEKSIRYEVYDFFENIGIVLEEFELDNYSEEELAKATEPKQIRDWQDSLVTVWMAKNPLKIEFVYQSRGVKELRTIELIEAQANEKGVLYFLGVCHDQKAERHFRADRIQSKVTYDSKEYDVPEFVQTQLGLELSAN